MGILRAYDSQRFKPVVTFYFGIETENPDLVVIAINCIGFKTISFFEFLKRLNSSSHFSLSENIKNYSSL